MIGAGQASTSEWSKPVFEIHFPDESKESERARLGQALEEAEACSGLWMAVIELAVRDLKWLRRIQHVDRLARHEAATMREVLEGDPVEFFTSEQFNRVCDMLGAPADVIRSRFGVDDLLDELPAA